MNARVTMFAGAATLGLFAAAAPADVTTLVCDRDNTLIQDESEINSNGQGDGFFAGRINLGTLRRGLVHFDVSAVPAGSTVTGVRLLLSMTQTNSPASAVAVHRCLANWGEGTSFSTGGLGSPATVGDATWHDRFYPNLSWATEGGEFTATPSASVVVDSVAGYEWSSPAMVADVQAWVNGGAGGNFGWVVLGDESGGRTVKKFGSREAPLADRPRLEITFTPPGGGCPVDWDDNTQVQPADVAAFVNDWFNSLVQGTLAGDFDGNHAVQPADVALFVTQWFAAVSTGAC